MILSYKNLIIDKEKISFKKFKHYSNDFIFIPIQYNKRDILIQTPHCFIPFGLNQYSTVSNKKYLDASLQDNNKEFIHNCFKNIYQCVYDKYSSKFKVESFIKENQYSNCIIRFKVDEGCSFYDQNKQQIQSFQPKIFGIFIIHLSGLWLMNNTIWFNWTILQARFNIPIQLKEYAFIDEEDTFIESKDKLVKSAPPPPPPPPPLPPPPPPLDKYNKMKKVGVPTIAIEHRKQIDRIQASDLKKVVLKKTTINTKIEERKNKKNRSYMPSLDEIRNALQSLQKLN